MRGIFRLVLAAVLAGCGLTPGEVAPDRPPNVILLVSDDQGWADFSATAHAADDVKTPNLDRLAAGGMRFTQAYATASICSPSRSGFITGRYQQRWGAEYYGTANLSEKEVTLPMLLKRKGYATGKVGKTHYGRHDPESFHFPLRHGFDEFYGFMHHTKHYLKHTVADGELFKAGNLDAGPMWVGNERKEEEGYATRLFEHAAVDFIRRHRSRPFYLQVSFNAIHLFVNHLPPEDLKRAGLPPVDDWDPRKEPGRKGYGAWYRRHLKQDGDDPEPHDPHGRARYLIALDYLDRAVGAILDALDDERLTDDTLIFYFSDNGGSPRTYARNKPLRGYKYGLYEGGIRVPFVIRWPGQVPEGRVSDQVVSTLDVVPMVAFAVDLRLPGDREFDGLPLLPLLGGGEAGKGLIFHRTLFWSMGRNQAQRSWAVREADWKLIHRPDEEDALFDLKKDVSESRNLAAEKPEVVERLRKEYLAWRESIGRP